MSNVFVVDTSQRPLHPVHPGRARCLLNQGKAAVYKMYPFTIILKEAFPKVQVEPLRLKLDPGSRTTGIAVVNDVTGEVVFAAELTHRGQTIHDRLQSRRGVRRGRRARHTRYRKPRFKNRKNKKKEWLPPSLESRISNILTWVQRLLRLCPIAEISLEVVKFDLQLLENAEISGVQYQQGTLQGYEIREYLLQKWERTCAYCCKKDNPLQVEHIQPKSKGGTNRVSNLCLACEKCNDAKGTQDLAVFLKGKPDVLAKIQAQAKRPLKDAAAVNATRCKLLERLRAVGLPIECGSGGLTKFNRTTRALPKTHWLDAACVGKSTPETLHAQRVVPLLIKAMGHGSRQMCRMDQYGFPRTGPKQARFVKGFQTGDIVRAVVPERLKCRGTHVGRVAVKAAGTFTIATKQRKVTDIPFRYCQSLHRSDGYSYHQEVRISPLPTNPKGGPVSSPRLKEEGSAG